MRIRPNLQRVQLHKKCSEWLPDYCVPGNAVPTVKITLGMPFPGVPAGNDPGQAAFFWPSPFSCGNSSPSPFHYVTPAGFLYDLNSRSDIALWNKPIPYETSQPSLYPNSHVPAGQTWVFQNFELWMYGSLEYIRLAWPCPVHLIFSPDQTRPLG